MRILDVTKPLILVAKPGAGKTLLARRLARDQELQARFRTEFAIVAERLHRYAGLELARDDLRLELAPFRAPHYSVSLRGMQGAFSDGYLIQPGELSIAHGGVLFLDEAHHFAKEVLAATSVAYMRKRVFHSDHKHEARVSLPADFALILATDPTLGLLEGLLARFPTAVVWDEATVRGEVERRLNQPTN